MEFLEQAASSRVAIVTVTGRGEARPDQSLSVQVCSLGFPGAGSLNARAAWDGGVVSDDLCSMSPHFECGEAGVDCTHRKGTPSTCLSLPFHSSYWSGAKPELWLHELGFAEQIDSGHRPPVPSCSCCADTLPK